MYSGWLVDAFCIFNDRTGPLGDACSSAYVEKGLFQLTLHEGNLESFVFELSVVLRDVEQILAKDISKCRRC